MKPKICMNKLSGDVAIVTPWLMAGEELEWMANIPVRLALTSVEQVGWMFSNENGVYFGLPMDVIDQFEMIGEL